MTKVTLRPRVIYMFNRFSNENKFLHEIFSASILPHKTSIFGHMFVYISKCYLSISGEERFETVNRKVLE